MQRINHMLSPKKPSARWNFLQTIAAAVVITAGSLAAVAMTDAAVAKDQTSQDRPMNADKAPMKIHDVVLRVTSALTKGDINSAQAAELILAAQQKIKSMNAYAAYKQELIADFKSGKITREEIGSKLDAHQKQLDTKMIKDFKERMNAAVKGGTMSSEEVRQVWGIHKKISEQASKTITREDYAAAQAKMQAMVDKGEMTEQQMREKLVWMRQMIGKSEAADKTITREDYAAAQAKMQVMVEKGEITQAQMDERLMGMRRMIGKSKAAGKSITREDYAAAQAKMQAMVDKGEITQAQMDERLMGMRRAIGKPKATDKTITREDYATAQAEMQAMVDKGEITEEQMNARLNRMRKMIARGNGSSERREMSDECKELGRRIRTAVGNGNMTSEEARKLWEAEGCP